MQERALMDCAVPDLVRSREGNREFKFPPTCDNFLPGDMHLYCTEPSWSGLIGLSGSITQGTLYNDILSQASAVVSMKWNLPCLMSLAFWTGSRHYDYSYVCLSVQCVIYPSLTGLMVSNGSTSGPATLPCSITNSVSQPASCISPFNFS